MFDYQFTKNSLKHFRKLPRDIQVRIIGKLDYFCAQDNPLDFAEPLTRTDLGQYRFRIGDYRVSFDLEDKQSLRSNDLKILVIHDVDHRKDIYRR